MNKRNIGWNFWLQWVLAFTLGAAVGGAIGYIVGRAVGGVLGAALAGLVVGVALGGAQTLVLGRYLALGTQWFLATVVGSAVGTIAGGSIDKLVLTQTTDFAGEVVGRAVLGLVLGLAQGWVVRKQLPGVGWWALGCSVALAMGPFVDRNAVLLLGLLGEPVATFIRPAVSGAITGSLLVWLLYQSSTPSPKA
ncbi:hypothetical protein [Anthocerotibacter panamensis]|uniref:hypothetical protein n=1 Tax=Anthocerotibacter panamensis TaxID=2857077 RepID=UPI001C403C53|nr:hypothetical protein [Anthocerotibacter panamensis]